MSPWVLKFPMCYCLRWRHDGTSERIANLAERNFHRPSKQNGRPEIYSCCHGDQVVTNFLEPRLLAKNPLLSYQQSRRKTEELSQVQTNMSYATSQNVMPFVSELRATGHGEVWDHTDEKKLQQFGWRCTNTESSYDTKTLIGNWNEQRFDINRISKPKPIPSRVRWFYSLLQTESLSDWSIGLANMSCEISWDRVTFSGFLLIAFFSVIENTQFLFCISSIITILRQLMALDITLSTQAKYQTC